MFSTWHKFMELASSFLSFISYYLVFTLHVEYSLLLGCFFRLALLVWPHCYHHPPSSPCQPYLILFGTDVHIFRVAELPGKPPEDKISIIIPLSQVALESPTSTAPLLVFSQSHLFLYQVSTIPLIRKFLPSSARSCF